MCIKAEHIFHERDPVASASAASVASASAASVESASAASVESAETDAVDWRRQFEARRILAVASHVKCFRQEPRSRRLALTSFII